jgi:hypothetical protein
VAVAREFAPMVGQRTRRIRPNGWVVGEEAGVVDGPHEFLLVSALDVGEGCVCFLWNVKSAPSSAARARKAPCLVVCERGVCVFGDVYVCVCFEVGVSDGYGFS